jgi:predicted Zn finger-like uncharacterized protein
MVIQCPECRTRFRFPDERMKPEGVKVRCARCMHIFLAHHPAQEHPQSTEPQNVSPALFGAAGAFPGEKNSAAERWTADSTAEEEQPLRSSSAFTAEATSDLEGYSPEPAVSDEEDDSAEADFAIETPEGLVFADPVLNDHVEENILKDPNHAQGPDSEDMLVEGFDNDTTEEDPFASGGGTTDEAPGDDHLSFDQEPEADDEETFSFDTPNGGDDEFLFDQSPEGALNGDFDFGQNDSADPTEDFGFGEDPRDGIDPFAFSPQRSSSDSFELEGNTAVDSFFDSEDQRNPPTGGNHLTASPPEPIIPRPIVAPEPVNTGESYREPRPDSMPAPPAAPVKKKRSSMGSLLTLVLILLLGLVGFAGYVIWQGGPEEMVRILDRAGVQAVPPAAAGQIRLNDLRSFFVQNDETGQLFVISGQAINDFQQSRSAIAIKGVLYGPQGEALLQQTVFAGNPMMEDELRQSSFPALEEKMNNQFGESLSNLNIAPGKSIPFTIVFKELPENLAEFTVEIADSRPGSGQ